jgi:DNA-binding response OmpR family regulator
VSERVPRSIAHATDDEIRVFSVDPDAACREAVARAIAGRGIACSGFELGRSALAAALEEPPNMILAELALPDLSGLGLCRLVRENRRTADTAFVLVSSRDSEIDRVLAFEAGADDFVAKPFYASELGARVSAILKRVRSDSRSAEVSVVSAAGSIQIDAERHRVTVDGEPVELSATEFSVLVLIASQGGRVVPRAEMIHELWGREERRGERIVDSHVKAIRRKLGRAGACIETVRGSGYRYCCERA